jgi:hypothetical protein
VRLRLSSDQINLTRFGSLWRFALTNRFRRANHRKIGLDSKITLQARSSLTDLRIAVSMTLRVQGGA